MHSTRADFELGAIRDLGIKWGWFAALGVALIILACVAFANLIAATVASVFMIGILMMIGAVLHIVHAFRVGRWSGFLFWLAAGLLYGVAGFLTFYNPILAAAVLTLILSVVLLAAGIVRIGASLKLRPLRGWGWLATSGIVTALAGIIFALGWPANTLFLLGIVLAVDLLFQGLAGVGFGLALKAAR